MEFSLFLWFSLFLRSGAFAFLGISFKIKPNPMTSKSGHFLPRTGESGIRGLLNREEIPSLRRAFILGFCRCKEVGFMQIRARIPRRILIA